MVQLKKKAVLLIGAFGLNRQKQVMMEVEQEEMGILVK